MIVFYPFTKKVQIKLATTCNRNEQQEDAKNSAQLYVKWKKMTWKMFQETWPKQIHYGQTLDA
jgi:hypothetical protein